MDGYQQAIDHDLRQLELLSAFPLSLAIGWGYSYRTYAQQVHDYNMRQIFGDEYLTARSIIGIESQNGANDER